MAQETDLRPVNSCCELLQNKLSKLQQKLAKTEEGRNFLKKALGIIEEKYDKIEAENIELKKEVEQERMQAEDEREKRIDESSSRVMLENEISSLRSEISSLKQKGNSGAQDVSNNSGAQDVKKEKILVQERLSEKETEINQLKELLQKEKERAESEKKKANTEKSKAENILADKQKEVKEIEQAIRVGLEIEISSLKSQIHLLQQELAVRDQKKEVTRFESQVSEKDAEINQLKKFLEKERTRAESEKKNAEAGKRKVNEAQRNAKTEKSRAEEEKRLAAIERKKAEEAGLQLERLRVQVDDLKAKLESETLKFQQVNEKLELEKQKADKDKKSADIQMAVAEEKNCLKCVKLIKKHKDVQEKAKREKKRADTEMRKAEEQRKVAETYREQVRDETNRCEQLAHELDANKFKTEGLEKKILELASSRTLLNHHDNKSLNTDTKRIKLLRKELRLEKMQGKHAKQVASFEKDRSSLLQQQIWHIKDDFSRVKDHLDMLGKCFLHKDAGIIDHEKGCNVSRKGGLNMKRKFLDEETCQVHLHSGNEHHKRKHAAFVAYEEEIAKKQKRIEYNNIGETSANPDDSGPVNNVTGILNACSEEIGNDWRSFEVADFNYYKLLYLDNPLDEESYRMAIERPLSPLPEIGSLSIGTNGMDNDGMLVHPMKVVSPVRDDMVPSCSPDVSSNPEHACKYFHGYYVIFSDINSNSSISKIFDATRTCLAQCSMLSQLDHMVQVTLSTLLKVEDLLPREKVCVFFSYLLRKFPDFALDNFTQLIDGDLIPPFESFARQMRSVMDDIEMRNIFEESLKLDDLVGLIEDFLIHRRVLVQRNVSSESLSEPDPIGDIVMDGRDLTFQAASDQQLVGAAIALASICTAVDLIGFVWETSYNMLRMQRIDSSMLAILHVFAYISGSKYFTNTDYSLLMMVIKSLVMFVEKEMSPTESASCSQPSTAVQLGFPPCRACPYFESAVSMDVVVSVLMNKLHNYVVSDVSYEGLTEAIVSLNSEPSDISDNMEQSSGYGEIPCVQCGNFNVTCCCHQAGMPTLSKAASYINLSYLGDILSLFELVASNMKWSWSFKNIVLKLLELLDSCDVKKFIPAILVLLGQLGRLGVDANGYEDTGVETIRGRLSSLLCQSTSTITVLPTQIAAVTALLGVTPVRFEEIIKINEELPEIVNDSSPTDCIRKWFSLLSKEEQSLTTRVLIAGVPSLGCR